MTEKELSQIAEKQVLKNKQAELKPDFMEIKTVDGAVIETPHQPKKYRCRVILRKFHAEISVRLNADTGELFGWRIPDRYQGASETVIDKEQALDICLQVVKIPPESVLESFSQEKMPDSHITSLIYGHRVNRLEVEGDGIAVQINSKTGKVISVSRNWNEVYDYLDKVDMHEAEEIAKREAPRYAAGKKFETQILGRKFIPFLDESLAEPKLRFPKVWEAVIFEDLDGLARQTTLYIDVQTGKVIKADTAK
jgi:uncharacterized membrane protein YkoI